MFRTLLLLVFLSFFHTLSAQSCLSSITWSLTSDNGDGTCTYQIMAVVNSGNGASGTATFSINGVVVYQEMNCTCNPTTITFPITVTCGSEINISLFYDAPGVGNDCSGSSGNISLPVIWYKPLTVKIQNNRSIINFSTAQEINNSHFDIHHSTDGKQFEYIGVINSKGNISSEVEYEFIHLNPTIGLNYYQVKQVDHDGRHDFSNVAYVEYRREHISFYPNPVTESLILITPEKGKLEIFSKTGRMVWQQEIVEGINKVDMTNLRSGTYFMKVGNELNRIIKI